MSDWGTLAYNALWVVGLAVVLATLSLAAYEGSLSRFRVSLALGLLLVCAGLLGLVSTLWERILWGCVVALLLVDLAQGYVRRQRPRARSTGH